MTPISLDPFINGAREPLGALAFPFKAVATVAYIVVGVFVMLKLISLLKLYNVYSHIVTVNHIAMGYETQLMQITDCPQRIDSI